MTPAFRPTARRTVAFVGPRGRVEVVEVFTGALLHRSRARLGRGARALAWSGDGSVLAVLGASRVSFWTVEDGRIVTRRLPAGRAGRALAAAPRGRRFAVALEHRGGGAVQLALARPDGIAGLLELRGRAISLAWSPGGRWLLAAWPAADQWILVRPQRTGLGAVAAVRGLRGKLGVRAGLVIGGWSGPPPAGRP